MYTYMSGHTRVSGDDSPISGYLAHVNYQIIVKNTIGEVRG